MPLVINPPATQTMNIEQARFNMIEQQIRPWDVLDTSVLSLLSRVKREDYVPVAHKALAFVDMEIPLGQGQSMLAPRVEARLLQDLKIKPTDTALEIGTGSGYFAALLAHKAQSVLSLEINPELAQIASQNLQRNGVQNVQVKQCDGAADLSGEGRFDVIILSGSVAEVPASLLQLLKPGGRLAAIVGQEPMMHAQIITRVSEGSFESATPWDTCAARLTGFSEAAVFKF
jgi:protein-L-isoaspartate(D-aspartate) O-methyltransferase